MLTTNEEIKEMLIKELHWLKDRPHVEDDLREIADGLIPLYYEDIADEWIKIPNEEKDEWHELHDNGKPKYIFDLMRLDLMLYYQNRVMVERKALINPEGDEDE